MKKLLIVVDYQKDFVNGSLGFKEAEDLDEYLASLIDQYHQNKDDVIFTFDTHQNNYLETQEGICQLNIALKIVMVGNYMAR